uniref:Uncharacterized protein n=1 Tax=Glossina pallidipes TaxID=7398 RepID=A0A1A9ZNZ6_GLOPL
MTYSFHLDDKLAQAILIYNEDEGMVFYTHIEYIAVNTFEDMCFSASIWHFSYSMFWHIFASSGLEFFLEIMKFKY